MKAQNAHEDIFIVSTPSHSFDEVNMRVLQLSLVPWLISRFGVAYKRDGSPDVVREMIVVLIERDNISGLGKEIDLLKDRHAKAF